VYQINKDIETIKILTNTMTQLQKERGLSSGYIKNKSLKLHNEIIQQRLSQIKVWRIYTVFPQ